MAFKQGGVLPSRLGPCCIYPSEIVSLSNVRLHGWNLRTCYLLLEILRLGKHIGLLPQSRLAPLRFVLTPD